MMTSDQLLVKLVHPSLLLLLTEFLTCHFKPAGFVLSRGLLMYLMFDSTNYRTSLIKGHGNHDFKIVPLSEGKPHGHAWHSLWISSPQIHKRLPGKSFLSLVFHYQQPRITGFKVLGRIQSLWLRLDRGTIPKAVFDFCLEIIYRSLSDYSALSNVARVKVAPPNVSQVTTNTPWCSVFSIFGTLQRTQSCLHFCFS